MKISLIPTNAIIGDYEKNLRDHFTEIRKASQAQIDLVVFPELSSIGYAPRDLLYYEGFLSAYFEALENFHKKIAKEFPKIAVLLGGIARVSSQPIYTQATGRGLANVAYFFQGNRKEIRGKTLIPFYDIFTESRYFDSALYWDENRGKPIEVANKKIGVLICEDSWASTILGTHKIHQIYPMEELVKNGADFFVNISASPFEKTKCIRRRAEIRLAAKKFQKPIFYLNRSGAQDEILFDGDRFGYDARGGLIDEGERFSAKEKTLTFEAQAKKEQDIDEVFELYTALVYGIKEYFAKSGFTKAVLGLSGGIDSAVVATLAVDALGAENVLGIAMPSKFSSPHSVEDAEALAKNLNIRMQYFPIKMAHSTLELALQPFFSGKNPDETEENLQSRLRGVIVMAFANKFRSLVLATGNKSELSMGYSTIYGDLCGALLPIGDLWKEDVYRIAHFINRNGEKIPQRSITKEPSAELRPNQKDQDSLPPYEKLDPVLVQYIEQEKTIPEIFAQQKEKFFSLEELEKIKKKILQNEHKRFQAPPILKVSRRAFGSGRQVPINYTI